MIKELKEYYENKNKIKSLTAKLKIIMLQDSGSQRISKLEKEIDILTLDVNKVDIAIDVLCDEDRFIVQKKCFEHLSWLEVEAQFNATFHKRPPVTYYALRKNLCKTEKILKMILEPESENEINDNRSA